MKKWHILDKEKIVSVDEIISLLLKNRGILAKAEQDAFLHPKIEVISIENVGIEKKALEKTLKRIFVAKEKKEEMIIYGDYDVDGITAAAILWETLYALGCKVIPYIPHRVDEGYGLSIKGIDNIFSKNPHIQLIVTVDNGIVAHEAVTHAKKLGIDVIITDHHISEEKKEAPDAYSIIHTTKLCGAGIAYVLSREILKDKRFLSSPHQSREDDHIELAALGTIADLVPLTGTNRAIVTYGLQALQKSKRPGIQALCQEAAIDQTKLGTYEVGYIIGPRLNAAGRIESAMDSLRLLCSRDDRRTTMLAQALGRLNRERQELTKQTVEHAIEQIQKKERKKDSKKKSMEKIIIISHETYNPGVIGLVAGRLVEEYYRPVIVLSIGDKHAKASVRSVKGVNIIEFLRHFTEMFVNVGGHTMAAGFTVTKESIPELQKQLEKFAKESIHDDLLHRKLTIDCELPFQLISQNLYDALQQLAPFGMGNPEPTFVSRDVELKDTRYIGREGKHVKLKVAHNKRTDIVDAIGFNMADHVEELSIGDTMDLAYSLDQNTWNGNTSLQLKLKDINISKTI